MVSASLKTSASPPHSVSYVSVSGLNSKVSRLVIIAVSLLKELPVSNKNAPCRRKVFFNNCAKPIVLFLKRFLFRTAETDFAKPKFSAYLTKALSLARGMSA